MKQTTEKRVVFYPCQIAGKIAERVGVFDVTFSADGVPLRADMPRFVGFSKNRELVEFYDEIEKAIFDRQNLHCPNVVNLDDAPAWDGTLTFEPIAILI